MYNIFIDTSAFIALLVASEKWHKQCVAKYREHSKKRACFYTNTLVLAELYTRIIYHFNERTLGEVIKHVSQVREEGALKIFQLDASLFVEAEKAIIHFSEHKLSFTDASIYALAKLYDMDEIFTLDQDFKKIGLRDSGIAA